VKHYSSALVVQQTSLIDYFRSSFKIILLFYWSAFVRRLVISRFKLCLPSVLYIAPSATCYIFKATMATRRRLKRRWIRSGRATKKTFVSVAVILTDSSMSPDGS